MLSRSERIKQLVEQSGKTYQELEKMTGIKKSSLQRYASGETTKIPLDAIEKMATAFCVTPGYLMGWETEEQKTSPGESLTEGEKILLNLFRRVPEDQQRIVLQMIRAALDTPES